MDILVASVYAIKRCPNQSIFPRGHLSKSIGLEERSYFFLNNILAISSNFCFLSKNVPVSIICFFHYSLNSFL